MSATRTAHRTGGRMPVHGRVEAGFGRVMDVFEDNFSQRGDLGAACAVYASGRPVVDIWAGVADARTGRPWSEDTAAVIFSCSKGILTICAYLLVQEGRLELDAPVARYWPEFAQHGKEVITVRCLLSHRAGLPALDRDLTRTEVLSWDPVIRAIEAQTPLWSPGSAHSYHAMTYGWMIGEVIHRVTGDLPGAFFRKRLADPMGLQTWIGLPESARESVAWMEPPLPDEDSDSVRAIAESLASPVSLRGNSMGGAFGFPVENGVVTFNDPALQTGGIPAANGISTARSLARLYAGCVSSVGGRDRILEPSSVDDAICVQSLGQQVFGPPDAGQRWGTGFMLNSPPARPMLGERSFGHDGAGGQLAFADDEYCVGFSYLSNQMGGLLDERANQLTAAVKCCLTGMP
jgi:CubicO group peptidase (beta-lactamase class C family)